MSRKDKVNEITYILFGSAYRRDSYQKEIWYDIQDSPFLPSKYELSNKKRESWNEVERKKKTYLFASKGATGEIPGNLFPTRLKSIGGKGEFLIACFATHVRVVNDQAKCVVDCEESVTSSEKQSVFEKAKELIGSVHFVLSSACVLKSEFLFDFRGKRAHEEIHDVKYLNG